MTLAQRDGVFMDRSIPQWKRELMNRKRTARTSTYAVMTYNNKLALLRQVGKQRDVAATNERALDRSRQPDFHLQQRASSAMSQRSSVHAAVGNMKLLSEVGARDSAIKSCARLNSPRSDRVRENYVKHVIEMNEEKCYDKLRFSSNRFVPRVKIRSLSPPPNDEENTSDSSEELQYGPGIVNRLKTKYMSMTLRDNQKKHARPSLSNLRKATSLDNLLDDDILDGRGGGDKTYEISSVISCVNKLEYSSKESSGRVTVNFCADLKRARSMETLQDEKCVPCVKSVVVSKTKITNTVKLSPTETMTAAVYDKNGLNNPLDSIVNDDIIIVENSTSETKVEEKQRRNCIENKELPPPDVVKETMKIFENCQKTKSLSKGWKHGNEATPKTASKKSCAKPVLFPKPTIYSTEMKKYPKKSVAICGEIVQNGCDEKNVVKNGFIEARCSFSSIKLHSEVKNELLSGDGSTPMKNGSIVTERIVLNGSVKKTSEKVIEKENGIEESPSQNEPDCKYRHEILKPLDTLPIRQVGIIRPLVSSQTKNNSNSLTPQEIEKNYINSQKNLDCEKSNGEKEKESENTSSKANENGVNGSTGAGVNKPSTLWIKKPWNQQQNTMVFNFKDREQVPDYIENDGLILQSSRDRIKRILQESGGNGYIILGVENGVDNIVNESSTDSPSISCKEEWQLIASPPSPCNVHFEGDNVVINGKSNLRKHPKEKKLRIQFNDTSTTFEYPSEASLLEDDFQTIPTSPDQSSCFSSTELPLNPCGAPRTSSPLSGSSLGNYVPCKLSMGESFELGVTKSNNCTNGAPATSTKVVAVNGTADQSDDSDYLKPAAETENVAWSEDSIPDLLF